MNRNYICIDDTRFIFTTNFSGDPSRDKYGDTRRKCSIVVPTEAQAKDLTKAGYKVKTTNPRAGEDPNNFVPEYFVDVQIKYWKKDGTPVKYPPKVYLIPGPGQPKQPLTEETIGCLDHIRVANVNVVLSPWEREDGSLGLFVNTIYVEQDVDDDPYAARYARAAAEPAEEYDDGVPFDN